MPVDSRNRFRRMGFDARGGRQSLHADAERTHRIRGGPREENPEPDQCGRDDLRLAGCGERHTLHCIPWRLALGGERKIAGACRQIGGDAEMGSVPTNKTLFCRTSQRAAQSMGKIVPETLRADVMPRRLPRRFRGTSPRQSWSRAVRREAT